VPGLGTSFGRGGATTTQQDLQNADAILIMGSSMAENHPVGFRFVVRARERGATVIHVDPRFTRTSAMSDKWVPIRAGTDIVFLGALINYVLERGKEFREYVVRYTNAPVILDERARDAEELDGLFSGWDPEEKQYDIHAWRYAGGDEPHATGGEQPASGGEEEEHGGEVAPPDRLQQDLSLEHSRCVFQMLKRHYRRYTPEMVEQACGVSKEIFLDIAEAFTSASGAERTAAIVYSVGWTQHSTGVQIIRAAAILQLLLGNIGRPGGGILALRGHASIQGSTDIPTLYDILPGYLPMPYLSLRFRGVEAYSRAHGSPRGWWANVDKYIVSLLKAYYGEAATPENEFGFNWLPRVTGDHSHLGYWIDMADGKMDGLFVIGQNPAVGAPNSRLQRAALAKLRWLVVRDLVETETASFWYDSPEVERGELRPEAIGTEVFFFPSAGHAEKEGTFTNTQRLLQWRQKAVEAPGDARSEAWFIYHLGRRLKEKARGDPQPRNAGLTALWWDYETEGPHEEPDIEQVLQEINGWTVADRKLVDSFTELEADGSTACGCWIYSGVFPEAGRNLANSREPDGFYAHGWGFAWPADRRILYNRASARPDGRPWSDRKKLVWWDEEKKAWSGLDVPDFTKTKAPSYQPPAGANADEGLPGDAPFIMHEDGKGWLWVPGGLKDGPLPTHYEPLESPVRNPLYPKQQVNPAADPKERPDNPYAASPDPRFPHVLTTYRLTEHHTAGAMSRTLSHLSELQPELFCEISPQLAAASRISHGDWVTIMTPRGLIEARALVTERIPSLEVDGRTIHQVGLPYHWGSRGLVTGDVVNDLLAISEEPNVRIMESKAMTCTIEPGRRPKGPAALDHLRRRMDRVTTIDYRLSTID
jgi:formate dehydrogenase major subunit